MKIYLSSTYVDLKQHRAKVALALRKAGYEVVMMEESVARDKRVEFACQGDVVTCDVYIGIFAWRYGHIPKNNNPEHLSVTVMEYAAAGKMPMPRLTFLLEEKARWPKTRKDLDLARINNLRTELKEWSSGYFSNAGDLTVEVQTALRIHESTRLVQQIEAVDIILRAQELGSSYMMNIKDKLRVLREAPFVELCLGPTPWWNSRLYLVAALAKELGQTRGFVFVDSLGLFLLMASPSEICYRLALQWPELKRAYQNFRQSVATLELVDDKIYTFPQFVSEELKEDEQVAKYCLSEHDLQYKLGIARDAEVVDVRAKDQRFLQREILGRQTPFVALVRDGKLDGLADRVLLAGRVALAALS